jgi:hypothetical protein
MISFKNKHKRRLNDSYVSKDAFLVRRFVPSWFPNWDFSQISPICISSISPGANYIRDWRGGGGGAALRFVC